ncbi:MAG: anhydro-N-acetylmuramic acid kinase [Bacteroidales bacterium]
MEKYQVIGLMSGTSLDGVDIAFCQFTYSEGRWTFHVPCAETISYSDDWKRALSQVETGSAIEFVNTDVDYGHLLGHLTREFILRHNIQPDFIASHGHTIFHQPDRRITSQIGRGSAIAAETGHRVVCDFRSTDVALGGQGAPLVPIGDMLLFKEFDFCLNIGGFTNISFQSGDQRIAYDICPANIVLNQLASRLGLEYDADGDLAASGVVNDHLLEAFNALPFYAMEFPKSLGKEWVLKNIFPLMDHSGYSIPDLLATFCEHIAMQVALSSGANGQSKMLITGGGAFNKHLIGRIIHHAAPQIFLPSALTINFKEAMIFAFLGVLRWRNETTCLQSVTGAIRDSSSGAIY